MNEKLNPLVQKTFPLTADSHLGWLNEGDLVVLIINFHAGTISEGNGVTEIIDEITKLDVRLEVYRSKGVADATVLAAKHGLRANLIVCVGGDGTLNEVCSGLMTLQSPPPLAYIAAGTTCDFARTLRLPINDYREAARIISSGHPVPLDIGKMNTKHFVYVASFGAFTSVASNTPQKLKKSWGHLAYVIEGLRSLPSVKPIPVRIELEDAVIEDELLFGAISNTTSIGGLLRISEKNVLMDDGKFEVMLIKFPTNPLDAANLLSSLIDQNYHNKNIYFFSTARLRFTFPDDVRWTLDGEDAGLLQHVDINNMKQALRIVIPVEG